MPKNLEKSRFCGYVKYKTHYVVITCFLKIIFHA